MSLVLGIETTCDETSAAVVRDGRFVLSNVVWSQVALHARYGGVVPEIAARAHIESLNRIVDLALQEAAVSPCDLTAVGVANRPGLIGCLLVGATAAKAFSFAWNLPLMCVDHVHAHLYSACLFAAGSSSPSPVPPPLPAIGLVISGGHTSLYRIAGFCDMLRLGATVDDAVGEAFDKVAAILHLGYPGGPLVDRLARHGNPRALEFPISLLGRESMDFSFSGLKTAVLYHVNGPGGRQRDVTALTPSERADVAASFQHAVATALAAKLRRALERHPVRSVLIGGGVAANSEVRRTMETLGEALGLPVFLPAPPFCTDNAAMIAGLAAEWLRLGFKSGLDTPVVATI